MIPCFFALAWPSGAPEAGIQADKLARQIDSCPVRLCQPGLILADLAGGRDRLPRLLPLTADGTPPMGALYGTLFRRGPGRQDRVSCFKPEELSRLAESDGQSALSDFWGHYVLFLRTNTGIRVLTDPTSAIPCFWRRLGDVAAVFSHLEACPSGVRANLTHDIPALRRLRLYDKIQTGQTGFREIRELGGGQSLDLFAASEMPRRHWDPREIAARPLRLPDGEAAEVLRKTVSDCVASWAGTAPHIALDLSGGLDSSIVASCLARPGVAERLDLVHHHVRSGDPPERAYAEAVCAHLGHELTPVDVVASRDLPDMASHPASVRPWRQFLGLGFDRLLPHHLTGPDTVFFTGQGGDHLFLMTRSALGLTDCARLGPRRHLIGEWIRAARLSDLSIWQVLAVNFPHLLGRPGQSALELALRSRIAAHGLPEEDAEIWLDGLPDWTLKPGDLPPGKFEQVSTLLHMFLVRDPLIAPGSRAVIHPLISQPLIELCLRLPVWQLCLGGLNRGLARKAFDGAIPDLVRLRMTKGEATQYFVELLTRNHGQIVQALEQGMLMETGLLPQAELGELLSDTAGTSLAAGRELLLLYVMEAWMRATRSQPVWTGGLS